MCEVCLAVHEGSEEVRLEVDYGVHTPMSANERFLLPSVAYVSTHYCKKYTRPEMPQTGVILFVGLLFQWWTGFLEIRIVTGKIGKLKDGKYEIVKEMA